MSNLRIEKISIADRDWIHDQLPITDIRAVAEALLQRLITDPDAVSQAETIIQRIQNLDRDQTVRQEAARQSQHYIFAVPSPEHSNPSYPAWQPFRVHPKDLESFAHAWGVSVKALLRVAKGEVHDVGGVRQGPTAGTMPECVGRNVALQKLHKIHPPSGITYTPVGAAMPIEGVNLDTPTAGYFLPLKNYTPAEM